MDIEKELLADAMNIANELQINIGHYIHDAIINYNQEWKMKEEAAKVG